MAISIKQKLKARSATLKSKKATPAKAGKLTKKKSKVTAAADEPIKSKKLKKGTKGTAFPAVRSIVEIDLDTIADKEYYTYGVSVIEDRAIFGSIDGLKPVARRSLWATHKLGLHSKAKADKSAKVVGETLGNYHPHGDKACLRGDTLVPLLNGKTVTIKELTESKAGPKWVLAFNEETHNIEPAKARSWRVAKTTDEMVQIRMSTGEVHEATTDHPFLTRELGWVEAADLLPGQHIVGGTLLSGAYTELAFAGMRRPVHQIVGDFVHGGVEDDEIYHHTNENSIDNRPSNIVVMGRADHALHHGDYLKGLSAGRDTMFAAGTPMREAIKRKNSALLRNYNQNLWLVKAVKAIKNMQAAGLVLNPENYAAQSDTIYNLTKLKTLEDRGISFSKLVEMSKTFKLDTSSAVGHTAGLKSKTSTTQSFITQDWKYGAHYETLTQAAKVLELLVAQVPLTSATWKQYESVALLFPSVKSNKNAVVFANPSKIKEKFGVKTLLEFAALIPASLLNVIVQVKKVKLKKPENFYDFTVPTLKNMIVLSSDGLRTGNFSVVHNCYDAIVNAVINQNIAMISGEGNFGTMVEGPAAMRYCFTDDALVTIRNGDNFEDVSFKDLAKRYGVYEIAGAEVEAALVVLAQYGADVSSHIVCAGVQDTVRVRTVDGNSVRCTPNEPFKVYLSDSNSYQWVNAEELQLGNLLVRTTVVDGIARQALTAVAKVEKCGREYVYDLCVPDTHSFTANGYVVHNTNLKLSKYSDLIFFDKFYLPTIEMVPNYDGSRTEPLNLPALLPNALINGNFGIAPGVNTRSPMFTLNSVISTLQEAIKNKNVCTPAMCLSNLEFTTSFGGKAVRTKSNKADFLNFYKTGKGRITFVSSHGPVQKDNSIRFDRFAPISDMEKTMGLVESIAGVAATRDDSDKHDIYQTAFVITFAKSLKGAALDKAIKAVENQMSSTYTFDVKTTDRFVTDKGQAGASLRSTNVPDMLTHWLKYRVELERKACEYWLNERKKDIAYIELIRLAISKLDLIIKHVKNKKLDDAGLVKAIAKDLKITGEQVNIILARNLRQLRHLEDQKLVADIKEIRTEMKGYEGRIKRPSAYIAEQLDVFAKSLS